jgi:hypothetical protein
MRQVIACHAQATPLEASCIQKFKKAVRVHVRDKNARIPTATGRKTTPKYLDIPA